MATVSGSKGAPGSKGAQSYKGNEWETQDFQDAQQRLLKVAEMMKIDANAIEPLKHPKRSLSVVIRLHGRWHRAHFHGLSRASRSGSEGWVALSSQCHARRSLAPWLCS